tara:strand:+ start:251 stop:463 length:213 start_codon:yes stop_codon:yes gene_type:complete
MKIPGYVKVQLSLLMILAISSVLSTVLQILTMGENILEENTFMRSELQREKRENKNKNPIGKNITDLAQN